MSLSPLSLSNPLCLVITYPRLFNSRSLFVSSSLCLYLCLCVFLSVSVSFSVSLAPLFLDGSPTDLPVGIRSLATLRVRGQRVSVCVPPGGQCEKVVMSCSNDSVQAGSD